MDKSTFEDIRALIELFDDSDWQALSIEVKDFSLRLSRNAESAGLAEQASHSARQQSPTLADEAPTTAEEPATAAAGEDEQTLAGLAVVRAPNLGLFYRSPKPGAAPYVQVGDEVGEDTEVCLIEVMKLFTPVVAGIAGIVRRICVDEGALVEYDQPLFYVEPRA